MNPKITLTLGIMCIIGVIDMLIGLTLDDPTYWLVSDIFVTCAFGVMAVYLLYTFKKLK